MRRLAAGLCSLLLAAAATAASPGLGDFFAPHLARRTIAGAVTLVADRDGVVAAEAFGLADVAAGRPMRPDTVFWIASQSKPMTAVALLMLVDEGRVAIDDPVERHLPEFKGQLVVAEETPERTVLRRPARPISVRDILSHTAGLRFRSPLEQPTLDGLALRDAVRAHALQPLQWEPGTRYLYSNAGINIAGRIIEVVAGIPYEDFLRSRLFGPLGMADTTFWPSEAQLARVAKVYRPNAAKDGLEEGRYDQLRYPLSDRTRYPMPAGGLFSTAADVARFARMMLRGGELDGRRYLSPAAVALLTRRQTPAGLKESYGLGFTVGQGEFGHGGALGTETSVDLTSGLVTIFLIQQAGFAGDGARIRTDFKLEARRRYGGGRSTASESSAVEGTTGSRRQP